MSAQVITPTSRWRQMPAPESVPAPSAIQAKTIAATASSRREPRAASAIWARVGTRRTL